MIKVYTCIILNEHSEIHYLEQLIYANKYLQATGFLLLLSCYEMVKLYSHFIQFLYIFIVVFILLCTNICINTYGYA